MLQNVKQQHVLVRPWPLRRHFGEGGLGRPGDNLAVPLRGLCRHVAVRLHAVNRRPFLLLQKRPCPPRPTANVKHRSAVANALEQ